MVQHDLDGLAENCMHINGALAGAKASSTEMAAETERVARELAASQQRSRLAEQFLQQYQLSPDEVACPAGAPLVGKVLKGFQLSDPSCHDNGQACILHVPVTPASAWVAHVNNAAEDACDYIFGMAC